MAERAAIYARFSTDMQRPESIDDQVRLCRAAAERLGCEVIGIYEDKARSGGDAFRNGYQTMLRAARGGEFEVLVAEALDRLSRDQEDIAALYKALTFAGVRIVTHAEGEINELHVGLKGTMNALFLKDLAQKTHRGLRGRAEAGKSAGGLCFGYRVVRALGQDGELSRGERAIEPGEAAVVRRIFEMFTGGASPIGIAKQLNAEAVPGPQGKAWRDTTIRGHALRGTGILRNELYVGRQIWNRMQFRKDPATGKRVSRMNPSSAWVTHEVPELRIVESDVWERAQARLDAIRQASGANDSERPRYWESRRAKHLLTGKLVCGVCGGAFSAVGKDFLGCTAARRQGVCHNRAGIRRPVLENLILAALRERLMQPDDLAAFIADFTVEWNRLQAEASALGTGRKRELEAVNRKLAGLIDAIADGLRGEGLQHKLDTLESRKRTLEREMTATPPLRPALHPNLAQIYRAKVAGLQAALHDPADGHAALEATRGLIERVVIHPGAAGDGFEIELTGELAAMLGLGMEPGRGGLTQRSASGHDLFLSSVKVVAGMRSPLHPNLAQIYRAKVADLQAALHDPADGHAALEAARGLIERVVIHPGAAGEGFEIELTGELAAMLGLGMEPGRGGLTQRSAAGHDLFLSSVKVVAGTGFEPVTFRL